MTFPRSVYPFIDSNSRKQRTHWRRDDVFPGHIWSHTFLLRRVWRWWTSTATGAAPASPWPHSSRRSSWRSTTTSCPTRWPKLTSFLNSTSLKVTASQFGFSSREVIKSFTCINLQWTTGEPVAVVHGANAPLLGKMIENEMFKERMVMAGEMERQTIQMEEAVPRN